MTSMPEDVQFTLGRIDGKLDMLLKYRDEQKKESAQLDERITKLENWRWMLFGGASVVSVVVGLITRFLK